MRKTEKVWLIEDGDVRMTLDLMRGEAHLDLGIANGGILLRGKFIKAETKKLVEKKSK